MPAQHYYNVQIWMRGTYVSQAVSKSLDIPHYFLYQDSDDREEGMFGSARTLSHGTNFDLLQFEERASHLMSLEEIYARNPQMRKGSRRLGGVLFDHINPKSILDSPRTTRLCYSLTSACPHAGFAARGAQRPCSPTSSTQASWTGMRSPPSGTTTSRPTCCALRASTQASQQPTTTILHHHPLRAAAAAAAAVAAAAAAAMVMVMVAVAAVAQCCRRTRSRSTAG